MRWPIAVVLALVCCGLIAGATSGEPTSTRVHFTAAGDYGASATTTNGVLNALAANGSDAHFALGDMSYGTTGAEEQWCSFVKARVGAKFPFELIAGNHESNGENGNINDFSACLPNQLPGVVGTYGREYFVDVPQVNPLVRFVMISPNLGFPGVGQYNYPAGSARYQWVSNTIDAARTAQIPWVVVGMHKPCVSMGIYACDPGADITNLMLSKKVDLVLSGHEHMYQRTKQLALRTGCSALTIGSYNPSCVADSDDALTQGAGTVFATVGTGGIALRDVNLADPEAGYFAASSGANQNPTFGFGDFDVTPTKLTASFLRGFGGTFTDQFTITKDDTPPPPNQDPTASFTSSSSGLTASFDAEESDDPDGTIASYAWDFGDDSSGTGETVNHPYAAAGTYQVKLTVTDDDGATATVTHGVTVTAPTVTLLASDEFERSVATGWGTADVGGPWTIRGTASRLRVAGGAGQMQVPSSATYFADLNNVTSTGVRMTTEFSVDKLAQGTYVALIGRRTSTTNYYAGRLVISTNGGGVLYLTRGSGTSLGSVTLPANTFAPNARYRLAMEAKGTSPTLLATKVWRASDPEPTAWQRTASDSVAALQVPGQVSVFSFLPSAASASSPVTVSYHQISVTRAD